MSFTAADRALLQAIAGKLEVGAPTPLPPDEVLVFGKVPPPNNYTPRFIAPGVNTAWDNLGPRRDRGIVLHRMLGTLDGTDGYFRREARAKALTDFGIGLGKVYRWTTPGASVAPWASGPADGVRGNAKLFLDRYRADPVGTSVFNRDCRSVEIAGNYNDLVPEGDYTRLVEIVSFIADAFRIPYPNWPRNNDGVHCLLGHSEITAQKPCPGKVVYDLMPTLIEDVRERLRSYQEGSI